MKQVFFLLLIVGLVVVGWINRDKMRGFGGSSSTVDNETPTPTAASPAGVAPNAPPGTPHPATEARAKAILAYPGLKLKESAINKKFLALYAEAERTNPQLLAQPDWPITLAGRAAIAAGGAEMPIPTPPPPPFKPSTSILDQKSGMQIATPGTGSGSKPPGAR